MDQAHGRRGGDVEVEALGVGSAVTEGLAHAPERFRLGRWPVEDDDAA